MGGDMQSEIVREQVRDLLARWARLSKPADRIGGSEDLFRLGLDSQSVINLMLALEERFEMEFPEERLKRASFATLDTIVQVVRPTDGP